MPELITNEKRKYTRLAHTAKESVYLSSRGLRPVISSNVSAVGMKDNALIVRFHGGATYSYPGQGDRFEDIINAPSKGKWVWRELRRAGVAYNKIGSVEIIDDVDDRDLMREDAEEPISDLTDFLTTMVSINTVLDTGIITRIDLVSIINAGIGG